MVKTPYVDKNGIIKGGWSEEEDNKLRSYVLLYGHWNWRELPRFAGLSRCGKSCRLRWMNYLKPGLKRGRFDHTEEELVLKLHKQLGNRWSAIAAKLEGRTDNEVKNYWHTHLKKRKNDQNAKPNKPTIQNEGEHNGGSSISPQTTLISQKQDFVVTPNSTTSCLQDSAHHVPTECSSTESSYSDLGVMNSSMLEDHDNGLLEPFDQSHDSFWSEPFFTDTFSYSEASNSPIELSEVSIYDYSWYMEDIINS